jgi:predicted phosphodiesterase
VRYALVSDIHANLEALQAILQDIGRQPVDRIVCLGDIVGYHSDPAECLAIVRRLDPIWVAGNHDRAVTGQITTAGFSRTAARAVDWTRARLSPAEVETLAGMPLRAEVGGHFLAVHGAWHPDTGCETVRLDTDERRRLSFEAMAAHPSGARICAFGHTHRAGIYEWRSSEIRRHADDEVALAADAYYLVNPGTVGEPRSADRRATYLLLDLERRVAAIRRIAYDMAPTLRKSGKAGLLPRFSFLPIPMRIALKRYARALGLTR